MIGREGVWARTKYMAAGISWIFWPHCTVGGSGAMSSIFVIQSTYKTQINQLVGAGGNKRPGKLWNTQKTCWYIQQVTERVHSIMIEYDRGIKGLTCMQG